jgi:SMODS and SLOG-associating 2TM effector domain 1
MPEAVAVGAVPYRLWIGVTGHRQIEDEPMLIRLVGEVVEDLRRRVRHSEATPLRLGVISSLAEGADRLIAREILKDPASVLAVPLPMPRPSYMADFGTEESRQEFEELLGRASFVTALPGSSSRDEAYMRAGEHVLRHCDVLIAVWDGKPSRGRGGTGDICERAASDGVPRVWIRPRTDPPAYEVRNELGGRVRARGLPELDQYNREPSEPGRIRVTVEQQSERWAAQGRHAGLERLEPFLRWAVPYLARADQLARRYQALYSLTGLLLFCFAFLAVCFSAVRLVVGTPRLLLSLGEAVLLVSSLVVLWVARRRQLHARRISYRSLAERLRTGFFLAVAGVGHSRARLDDWVERSLEEVWMRRPSAQEPEPTTHALKAFLLDAWIEDQRRYHRKAGERNERRHQLARRLTVALFGIALGAALLEVGEELGLAELPSPIGRTTALLLITLPALAATVSGIREQRDYQRQAERFKAMAGDLEALKRGMEQASDLDAVRAVGRSVADRVLNEHRGWSEAMHLRDLELHV